MEYECSSDVYKSIQHLPSWPRVARWGDNFLGIHVVYCVSKSCLQCGFIRSSGVEAIKQHIDKRFHSSVGPRTAKESEGGQEVYYCETFFEIFDDSLHNELPRTWSERIDNPIQRSQEFSRQSFGSQLAKPLQVRLPRIRVKNSVNV